MKISESLIKEFRYLLLVPCLIFIIGLAMVFVHPFTNKIATKVPILSHMSSIGLIAMLTAVVFFSFRLLNLINEKYHYFYSRAYPELSAFLYVRIKKSLKVIFILIILNLITSFIVFPRFYIDIISKTISIIIIFWLAWLAVQSLILGEMLLYTHIKKQDRFEEREALSYFTKVKFIKKLLAIAVYIIALAAILMLFEEFRNIGISLIASAGFLSAVLGFAAQKQISAVYASFRMAFSQPIKIGDVVIIQNEYGVIEEITMNHVLVKLWDLRRMVVPVNYFFDQPFENWTYKKTGLSGSIFLYADFGLPLEALRAELNRCLEASPLWDKEISGLQLTNAKENCIELRIIVSAKTPSDLWDLRVEIREKLIGFINKNFPQYFPKVRQESIHQNA